MVGSKESQERFNSGVYAAAFAYVGMVVAIFAGITTWAVVTTHDHGDVLARGFAAIIAWVVALALITPAVVLYRKATAKPVAQVAVRDVPVSYQLDHTSSSC